MVTVRPLKPQDERRMLRTGNVELDRFFHKYAGQNQFKHHIGTTYVAERAGELLGFVTVAGASVLIDNLLAKHRKRLPRYPLPALRVARLATSQAHRGLGVGKLLLKHCFVLAREMAQKTGCVGILVDAKADATRFYGKYGFETLEVLSGMLDERPPPSTMFLALGAIPETGDV